MKTYVARLDEAKSVAGEASVLTRGWKVEFHRVDNSEYVTLGVFGERGGLKARLGVSMSQIREIVAKLDGAY